MTTVSARVGATTDEGRRDLWQEFVRRHWEREPVRLAGDQARVLPRVDADELFQAVVACVAGFLRGEAQKVRFYVDNVELDLRRGDHPELLPCAADGSFLGYHHRVAGRLGGADYALIVADWHQYSRSLWERVLCSLRGLTDHVGISRARMDTQLFLGTYKITPFGVHVDPRSAFHFPVVGTKRMRFWSGSFAERTPALGHADDYARYLGDSSAVAAGPGEAIYWPSDRWHVGESDGEFSVSWGLGYWVGDGSRQLAVETFVDTLAALAPAPLGATTMLDAEVVRTLAPVETIMQDMRRAAASDELRRSLISRQLEHDSAYGFLKLPPLLDSAAPKVWRTIRIKPVFRVLTAPLGPNELCAAIAGRSRILRSSTAILQAIDLLNRGRALELPEFVERGADDEQAEIADLVDLCTSSGAVCRDEVPAERTYG